MPTGGIPIFPPYTQSYNSNDSYGFQGLPPEIALEEQALNRKQQIANLLIQRGLQPAQGQQTGRFYVPPSPLQGLAGLAQAAAGVYGTHLNDEKRKGLSAKSNQMTIDAMQAYKDAVKDKQATTELHGPGAPIGQSQSTEPTQEDAIDTLSRLLPPSDGQPGGRLPQPIPNDGKSPSGPMNQIFNPNTGEKLAPPETPPIPSWANMSEMSGRDMSLPQQEQMPPPVREGPRPTSTTTTPATSEEKRQAMMEHLAMSRVPQAQRMGQMLMQEMDRKEAREDTQAFNKSRDDENFAVRREGIASNNELRKAQIESTALNTQALIDSKERQGQDASGLKRQLAEQTNELKKLEIETRRETMRMGKTPPGYRPSKEGNLEAIPGGPADTKLQGVLNQDTAMLQNSDSGFDRLASTANDLLNHPGLEGITGLRGKVPDIPGTDAANARALLNTLKSQIAFGVLQDMRNNSKTGGALGSVSDSEGKRLENNLAALDTTQGIDHFKRQLKSGVIDYATGAKDRLRDTFNLKHKTGEPVGKGTPAPAGMTPTVPAFHDSEKQKRYEEFKKNHTP